MKGNSIKAEIQEIFVDGKTYIPKECVAMAEKLDDLEYVIIRTCSAGVHAGYLKKRSNDEVELLKARRLWYWDGAASLSQLAMEGVKCPSKCKFPCEVKTITLLGVTEVIPCTEAARLSIQGVEIWKR